MGIFDFGTNTVSGNNKVKDECIIAFKVYDACRQQDCLEESVLGGSRAAVNTTYCGISISAGEIITPPSNAAAVSISDVAVERVVIVSKNPSPFRVGYWDIDLKYVFAYTLTFRDINGGALCSVPAQSVYNKTVTLFGSVTTESSISTDLLTSTGNTVDVNADPFVYVESKAVALKTELVYNGCCCGDTDNANYVAVSIGLFTIIKLFRLVNLLVESKGFCIPEECTNTGNLNTCDYFESLDFPMDVFAPPQKREFLAGISSNIPADTGNSTDDNCGCGCNNCGCGCAR